MIMKYGKLAQDCGERLPLEVMRSAAGYYIGTSEDGMPFSRESVEYFDNQSKAEEALETGNWTQRMTP
ncbi:MULTISPECIES: hypothetical protein [unclassified Vibrio]|uniref:hypothetical protein n=2 Tax=Vibrio TaxID=662 RepID=UPI001595CE63|nr:MULTISPECIES: hypothetical protein [unclassified Vibrio]